MLLLPRCSGGLGAHGLGPAVCPWVGLGSAVGRPWRRTHQRKDIDGRCAIAISTGIDSAIRKERSLERQILRLKPFCADHRPPRPRPSEFLSPQWVSCQLCHGSSDPTAAAVAGRSPMPASTAASSTSPPRPSGADPPITVYRAVLFRRVFPIVHGSLTAVFMHAYTYVYTHAYTHIYTHACVCVHACVRTRVYVHTSIAGPHATPRRAKPCQAVPCRGQAVARPCH